MSEGVISGRPDAALKRELDRYQALREMLSGEDIDPQTLLDTLEGATDLHEMLQEMAGSILDDEALAAAVGSRISALQERKSRLENTADHKRSLIIMVMERAGLTTSKGPNATLSVRPTKPKAIINDEAAIPARFFVPADPKLDRAKVLEALTAKEEVPGASLSNGGVSLSIRVK